MGKVLTFSEHLQGVIDKDKKRRLKNREAMSKYMQAHNKTVCEYCGVEKEGLSFVIGASTKPDWCMIEGTGKMACPSCYEKAMKEGQEAVSRATGMP